VIIYISLIFKDNITGREEGGRVEGVSREREGKCGGWTASPFYNYE